MKFPVLQVRQPTVHNCHTREASQTRLCRKWCQRDGWQCYRSRRFLFLLYDCHTLPLGTSVRKPGEEKLRTVKMDVKHPRYYSLTKRGRGTLQWSIQNLFKLLNAVWMVVYLTFHSEKQQITKARNTRVWAPKRQQKEDGHHAAYVGSCHSP